MKYYVFILILLYATLVSCVQSHGQLIYTIAGGGTMGDEVPATSSALGWFDGTAIDKHGNIFIAEGFNRVRRVDAITNIITTVAGTGVAGYNGDGIPATMAQINSATYIAFDTGGNLFIQDALNYRIRKVDITTGIISTYAGNGVQSYLGDNVPASTTGINPGPIACDEFNNLYIADANRRIRKVNSMGVITTIAGDGISGISGDGGSATAARVNIPIGLCTDGFGNIYFQDSSQSIRKITISTGIITRVAGTGNGIFTPYLGDGIAATTAHICPYGVAADGFGNLFIADACNERIEMVNASGFIYTVAGNGIGGYSGDEGPATAAKINYPEDVALDLCGNIYISDFGNMVVRKVMYPGCHYLNVNIVNNEKYMDIFPNPTRDKVNIRNLKSPSTYQLLNVLGEKLMQGFLNEDNNIINLEEMANGMYFLEVTDDEQQKKILKIVKL